MPTTHAPATELSIDEEDHLTDPVPLALEPKARRLAIAGRVFVAIGALLVVGVVVTNPFRNTDVLCSGVTLVVAGAVLRSIATPDDSGSA